uniref:Alpha-macroglobulin receptor-binding domain-containing protein n=1 Tax=Poecilia mexicana TaxID=48701 RepID=A0A3B3YTN6_9TELE
MIQMTLPVIATIYLDITSQWEAVGLNKRNEALQHIRTGYNNELAYRKGDGSFAVWANHGSSTWLTAYVTKVFSLAYNLIAVQNEHICGAVKYLILNAQQPDGMFKEVGKVYHGEMQVSGDVLGTDSDASMTAFCLIALQESRTICGSLPSSIPRAVTYLERRLPNLANPYAVAITSYALANENKLNREILYKFASPELNHWPISGKQTFTQETTGYALLALVRAQATIIVYQAVAEYWTKAKEPEYDLNVDILLPGRSRPDKFNFNRDNHFAHLDRSIILLSQCQMVSLYYTIPKEKESDCQKFNLSVCPVHSTYRYKDRDRDATMSILDIGLLTGFTVDTQDLDLLSTGRARTIARYEMNTVLSEKGSLIIYLDKVSHTRPEEISFRIHQTLKVGVLQPAAVSVYEYYDQAPCVKLYHPERQNGKLCKSYECICVEGKKKTESNCLNLNYKLNIYAVGKLRTFFSRRYCREALNVEKVLYKHPLICKLGNSPFHVFLFLSLFRFQYELGERTWIEYWPSEAECRLNDYQPTCMGFEEMADQYAIFGCQQ